MGSGRAVPVRGRVRPTALALVLLASLQTSQGRGLEVPSFMVHEPMPTDPPWPALWPPLTVMDNEVTIARGLCLGQFAPLEARGASVPATL